MNRLSRCSRDSLLIPARSSYQVESGTEGVPEFARAMYMVGMVTLHPNW